MNIETPAIIASLLTLFEKKTAAANAAWATLQKTFDTFPIGSVGFVNVQNSSRGWNLGYRMSQNFWRTEDGCQVRIEPGDKFIVLPNPTQLETATEKLQ